MEFQHSRGEGFVDTSDPPIIHVCAYFIIHACMSWNLYLYSPDDHILRGLTSERVHCSPICMYTGCAMA